MNRFLPGFFAVVAAGLALAGCAGVQAPPIPSLSIDRTLTYDSRGDYAGVFGVVGTEQNSGALCVFVDSKQGIGRGRINLVFPAGYTATPQGSVQDADGAVVATEGDKVAVSVAPELTDKVPAGCTSAGAGTAKALHVGHEE